jgi:Rps23 Pro-64 3,4-dihydroxylase Tpa1-like proline 4-hydroxylase
MINEKNFYNLEKLKLDFLKSKPFNHVIIDNFLEPNIAEKVSNEIPDWNDEKAWGVFYNNSIEVKKTQNHWNFFKEYTYRTFSYLNSEKFLEKLRLITDSKELIIDQGLHGGGYHCHGNLGKLNIHLDYNLHPKLNLQRKLNIIIYLSKNWKKEYGGKLELWSGSTEQAIKCEKNIDIVFNRAVLFDTTQNSWHGFSNTIKCPENISRKSLAIYYLQYPNDSNKRYRALFVPSEEQKNDYDIIKLCERRSKI